MIRRGGARGACGLVLLPLVLAVLCLLFRLLRSQPRGHWHHALQWSEAWQRHSVWQGSRGGKVLAGRRAGGRAGGLAGGRAGRRAGGQAHDMHCIMWHGAARHGICRCRGHCLSLPLSLCPPGIGIMPVTIRAFRTCLRSRCCASRLLSWQGDLSSKTSATQNRSFVRHSLC